MHRMQVVGLLLALTLFVSGILARSIPDLPRPRHKRQWGDFRISDRKAKVGLANNSPRGCDEVGCGIFDIQMSDRDKRAASDQRIAELQALMALSKGANTVVAHGQVNPYYIGKRKRADDSGVDTESTLYRLKLIERILNDLEEETS